ncbi:MAG: hypothetical protein MPJ22_05915 [Pirellulales bacterium]|nr:hypothetical protein [Pirellulales bacterium]
MIPEALYNPDHPRVGLGLVYKAPHIRTVSFAEAFFNLKTISEAEADRRTIDPRLMFIQINEASTAIPLPYVHPLFLDVDTPEDVTSSAEPRSPHRFKGFKLHRVIYEEEEGQTTKVAYPCLGGDSKSPFLHYQEERMIPELRTQPMESVQLADPDDEHWSIKQDPVYPACLKAFQRKFEASSAFKVGASSKEDSPAGGACTASAPSSASSSTPSSRPTTYVHGKEVHETVHGILDEVYALRVETLQEMGFIREVDRALTNTVMSEFIRLQLIMGEDLSKALRAMHADLEASTDDLIRDLDMVSMSTMGTPSENSAVQVTLEQYRELVKLRITLPLAKLDAAHEDMDRFL